MQTPKPRKWTLLVLLLLSVSFVAAPSSPVQATMALAQPTADDEVPPHPLLSNVNVRRALAYCTDRDALIRSVYPTLTPAERQALIMDTFLPKDHWLYSAPPAEFQYPFDAGQGRALLDQAGWTLAPGATYRTNAAGYELAVGLTTTNAGFRQTWAAALEQQWRTHCGIRLLRNHISANVFFGDGPGSLTRRDFETSAFAWVGQTFPGGLTLYGCDFIPTAENGWFGQNTMGWCNPVADAALKRGQNALERAVMQTEYAAAQTEFARDMVSLPLFQRVESVGVRKALQNYQPSATEYDTWNIDLWTLPGAATLVIRSEEPANLYRFNFTGAFARLEWLLFGKALSQVDYDYQPSLITQIPTLESGLAHSNDVTVNAGDAVVDSQGDAVTLAPGVTIRRADGQEVVYAGGPVQMKQLVVPYAFQPAIRWSDGQALKRADIDLAYQHDCDPAAQSYILATCAAMANVLTANTAYTITYKPGYQSGSYFSPPFLFYPSHQVITTPGSHQGKTLAQVPAADWFDLPEIMEQPLGVGPYRLKSWQKGQEMVFEKNPHYWRGAGTLAFDEVRIKVNLPFDEALQQLESGALHVLPGAQTTNSPDVQIVVVSSATWEHLDMNLDLYRQSVAKFVPATGGSVTTAVGISLTVPAGALDAGATMVINDIAAPTQPVSAARAAVRAFTLQALDQSGQPVTQFNTPVTLLLEYTDAELAERGISEDTLNVAWWDGAAWVNLLPCAGCGVDTVNNRVTVLVGHFSEFSLTGSAQIFLPTVTRN